VHLNPRLLDNQEPENLLGPLVIALKILFDVSRRGSSKSDKGYPPVDSHKIVDAVIGKHYLGSGPAVTKTVLDFIEQQNADTDFVVELGAGMGNLLNAIQRQLQGKFLMSMEWNDQTLKKGEGSHSWEG